MFDHKIPHLVSLRWVKKSDMLLAMVFMFQSTQISLSIKTNVL